MDRDPLFRNPRFDALRSALYHTERAVFLDRLNKAFNWAVIVLSAGVVGKVALHWGVDAVWFELSVLCIATLQLVFDFGSSARNHEFLQRRYYEMLTEMEEAADWDDAFNKKWSAKLLNISADEMLTMRALSAVTYNMALDGIYDDPETRKAHRQQVSRWQYLARNLYAFNDTDFQPKPGA